MAIEKKILEGLALGSYEGPKEETRVITKSDLNSE
jgi:hypothetical protein